MRNWKDKTTKKSYFNATLLAQQGLESSNQAFEKVFYL